ncbi:hypothetical protein AB0I72_23990 [Nocardiopsis sp. NPDC049922]|uniref:hypothetical protein n=1 Tax=Nocardiopsis sp. NPDC049922 TaxID=3155157 RepID=UPI0033FCE059
MNDTEGGESRNANNPAIHSIPDTRITPPERPDPFLEARDAFLTQRGLAFTLEWRRFPWTRGWDVDRALIGPSYLGNVSLGLKDGWSWGWQDRDGTWRYVQRERLGILVEQVIDTRAGFVPPLPRRGDG